MFVAIPPTLSPRDVSAQDIPFPGGKEKQPCGLYEVAGSMLPVTLPAASLKAMDIKDAKIKS